MNRKFSRPARCLIGGILGLTLICAGGCATRSQVSASNEISIAMFAIRDAEASGAETYAIEELQQAMALVKQAGETSGAEAERLAEQALVYAQLANATASRESARQQLMEAQQMDQEAKALKKRTTEAVEERLR